MIDLAVGVTIGVLAGWSLGSLLFYLIERLVLSYKERQLRKYISSPEFQQKLKAFEASLNDVYRQIDAARSSKSN